MITYKWPKNESIVDPITIFVASWGRPFYLWSCLDSLYTLTRSAARVVLLDNWHPDPLVGEVIRGFERRGLFSEVVRFPTNTFNNIRTAYYERLSGLGPLHVYLESDCMIAGQAGCWLAEMRRIMEAEPRLGMLGSLIDPVDFVAEEAALKLTQGDSVSAEFLAKLSSPERVFIDDTTWVETQQDFFMTRPPFPIGNPPGRLMMLRTDLMRQIGFQLDSELVVKLRELQFDAALTPLVRHRHLSLLNIFDYPNYDAAHRDSFFTSKAGGAA